MAVDPRITDTLLYGEGLCKEQHTCTSFVWDDEWAVFGDQLGRFGELAAKHVSVQFRQRPTRKRFIEPPVIERVRELENA